MLRPCQVLSDFCFGWFKRTASYAPWVLDDRVSSTLTVLTTDKAATSILQDWLLTTPESPRHHVTVHSTDLQGHITHGTWFLHQTSQAEGQPQPDSTAYFTSRKACVTRSYMYYRWFRIIRLKRQSKTFAFLKFPLHRAKFIKTNMLLRSKVATPRAWHPTWTTWISLRNAIPI